MQVEWSPWTTNLERSQYLLSLRFLVYTKRLINLLTADGVLQAARELGITVVAYSPLGRGFLTVSPFLDDC